MVLTDKDINFFTDNGYLVKRNLLDKRLIERARECLWDGAPKGRNKYDQSTWTGPFLKHEESSDGANIRRGFRWLYRATCNESWMVELLPRNPNVWEAAEELIGKGIIRQPESIRGIYCTLPFGEYSWPPINPHLDALASNLGVLGYIDKVESGGGGFTVWPKSHKQFYYAFNSRYGNDKSESYSTIYNNVCDNISPEEISGDAGDVVFWHHRLGHNASSNNSTKIRQAVFCDLMRKDISSLEKLAPAKNIWIDWSNSLNDEAKRNYSQTDQ